MTLRSRPAFPNQLGFRPLPLWIEGSNGVGNVAGTGETHQSTQDAHLAEAREKTAGKPLSTKDVLRALILPIGEEIAKSAHTLDPCSTCCPYFAGTHEIYPDDAIAILQEFAKNLWMNYEKHIRK